MRPNRKYSIHMKVLVIEYEQGRIQKIRELLNEIDDSITIVAVADDMPAAAKWLQQNSAPDLILAKTGSIAGMEQEIKATVTISTSHEQFDFEAFRFRHIRYIINNLPQTEERIAWDHVAKPLTEKSTPGFRERFLVKQGQKLVSIHISQIAYFFSQERFIFLKTFDNQKYLVEYRIEQLEKMVSPQDFFRINRSHIITLSSVKEIHSYFGNRLKLYLHPAADKDIVVSRKRVSDFKEWLGK